MIAGEGKYTAVNSKARSPCLLVFISQVVNYCAAGIIPGQWSPVGQRKIFQVLALCSVPTFLDHATAALGQGQSRAVLPRLGPCQQLRPPRARCVTKYSQIAAGPRGAWTCLTAHCQKCRSASKGLVTMELRSCGTLCGMWQTLECATWN